jgi:16S rRNA G527 N7-methylase RsmG
VTGADDAPLWSGGPPLVEPLLSVLTQSRRRHLIGPSSLEAQVTHSAGFAEHLAPGARVMDLGSGGGLPGLALIAGRPDLRVTLEDSAQRRVHFLEWAIQEMHAEERADVIWGRAEDQARDPLFRGAFDAVIARSFGSPAVTAECARPFLRDRGLLVVSEPPESSESSDQSRVIDPGSAEHTDEGYGPSHGARWPVAALAGLGFHPVGSYRYGGSGYQVLEARGECPDGLPRRAGVPSRKPRF